MEGCLVIKTQILSVFFSTPKFSFPCKDVAFILTISSFFPSLSLQAGGTVALRAHSALLGHRDQVSHLCQNLHRPICVLPAAAAVPQGSGEHHQPRDGQGPLLAVRLQHQQHAGHHGRQQLCGQNHLSSHFRSH